MTDRGKNLLLGQCRPAAVKASLAEGGQGQTLKKDSFSMKRTMGTCAISTTQGEPVPAFLPHPLPSSNPELAPGAYADLNHKAELALARLSGVSGLVPSVDWLLHSAIRKEALLTSQIEGTHATLTEEESQQQLPVLYRAAVAVTARESAPVCTGPNWLTENPVVRSIIHLHRAAGVVAPAVGNNAACQANRRFAGLDHVLSERGQAGVITQGHAHVGQVPQQEPLGATDLRHGSSQRRPQSKRHLGQSLACQM